MNFNCILCLVFIFYLFTLQQNPIDATAPTPSRNKQCKMAPHHNAKKARGNGPLGKGGKGKSCRWDKKQFYNDHPALRQSFAHICNAMMISMAIETAFAIEDQRKYDISIQAILDCFVPNECFPTDKKEAMSCTSSAVLHNIIVSSKELRLTDKSFGIFLKKKDYPVQYNHGNPKKQNCQASDKNKDKWAPKALQYNLYKSIPGQSADYVVQKTLDLNGMMALLVNHPFIVNIKTTLRMAGYKLNSAQELEDLSNAFDLEKDAAKDLMAVNHAFLVIGYVKPQDPNVKHVFFLVKTCLTGPQPWGFQGKGFMKMTTAKGGVYNFNGDVYSVHIKH